MNPDLTISHGANCPLNGFFESYITSPKLAKLRRNHAKAHAAMNAVLNDAGNPKYTAEFWATRWDAIVDREGVLFEAIHEETIKLIGQIAT